MAFQLLNAYSINAMVSQNSQNFQNHSFSKESRQPAPFQGILKDAQKLLIGFVTPQGGTTMESQLGDIACSKTNMKESFAGFVGFVTKNKQ